MNRWSIDHQPVFQRVVIFTLPDVVVLTLPTPINRLLYRLFPGVFLKLL